MIKHTRYFRYVKMTPFAKRISIVMIMLSLIFYCFVVTVSATNLPKVGIYNPSTVGFIGSVDGDYYSEISKFFQTEFFGDDIATNLTELKSRYDVIAVIDSESKISVEVESNFTQFVHDGGGLFVAGPLMGWKYPNGTTRPGYAFCKDALGISSVGETCTQRNITFDSNITDEKHINTGRETICYSYFSVSTGTAFAWKEGAATIHGVKNEYGSGRGVYFGSYYIGEGGTGKLDVNFSGRDEFILKIFNWLNGGNLTEPDVTFYPLLNAHDAVVIWTIDDSAHSPEFYYKNFSHDEIFEWMGFRLALQSTSSANDIKNMVINNTVMVGLHPTGEGSINRNTSKTPEEVQNDTEQYIIDCRNAWENLGYDSSYITGWRSSGFGEVYDPDNSYYDTGTLNGDEKVPEYPAFVKDGNITWTSEFYKWNAGGVNAQFPFNIVANSGYGAYNHSTTFPFLAYPTSKFDGSYVGGYDWSDNDPVLNSKIINYTANELIPPMNEALERHSVHTILTHAGVIWRCENGIEEVQKFLNYTKGKNVLFSDHHTFTNFWNARNNVNLSYTGNNVTVQAQDAIRGLTLKSKENISSAEIGDDYLIFVKGDRVVLPEIEAGDTLNVTIQNGSYNTSIPRISSITTTHPIYVLNATYNPTDKKVYLTLDLPYLYKSIYGSKPASVSIENFNHPFLNAGITTVSPANNLTIYINLSGETNIASVDMSVNPSISPVNITINNLSFPQSINFTASSANGNNVTFTICSLVPKGKYVIKRDDNYFMTKIADDCGCIEFNNSEWSKTYTFTVEFASEFDTGPGTYPSIMGIHNGTIIPSCNITVKKMYTYPCEGTGGHTEYVELRNETFAINATWNGYKDDWHNITFLHQFILLANHTYNYTIKTGSYPQIIHEHEFNATGGKITCTEFIDANGRKHNNWIPAIRLMIG